MERVRFFELTLIVDVNVVLYVRFYMFCSNLDPPVCHPYINFSLLLLFQGVASLNKSKRYSLDFWKNEEIGISLNQSLSHPNFIRSSFWAKSISSWQFSDTFGIKHRDLDILCFVETPKISPTSLKTRLSVNDKWRFCCVPKILFSILNIFSPTVTWKRTTGEMITVRKGANKVKCKNDKNKILSNRF